MHMVMQALDIKHGFTNSIFSWDENDVLISFSYPLNSGEVKYKNYRQFISSNGFKPQECIIIGDGSNDHLIMKEVAWGRCPIDTLEAQTLDIAKVHFEDFFNLSQKLTI